MLSQSLILDMPLAQVSDATAGDTSPQRRPFRTIGKPLAFGDAKLGASTMFDGASGLAVTLAGLAPNAPQFTVSFWLRITAPVGAPPGQKVGQATLIFVGDAASGAISLTAGPPGAGAPEWAGATLHLGTTVSTRPGLTVDTPFPLNGWRYIAIVRDGNALTLYVDGQPAALVNVTGLILGSTDIVVGHPPVGTAPAAALQGLKGEVAQLKVHKQPLAPSDLLRLSAADLTAQGRLDEALPLGIRLLDPGGNANLYIEDNPDGHALTVEFQNLSSYEISFAVTKTTAPRLTLTFPPGTLHPAATPAVREDGLWGLTVDQSAPDGSQTLILQPRTTTLRLAPGEVRTVTLEQMRAAKGDGTRPCRIACGHTGLTTLNPATSGPGSLSGVRDKMLQILDHTGSRFLPLAVDFKGGSRVLTGANDAGLTIQLRNSSSDRTIYFDPPALRNTGETHPVSVFELHLLPGNASITPSDDPLSLLAGSDSFDASVLTPPKGWTAEKDAVDSADPFWLIYPDTRTSLAPGEVMLLTLASLQISPLPGEARLRLIHRGLPGFWYGTQTLRPEKSPLIFDAATQVGIGVAPTKPLSIQGRASTGGSRSELAGLCDSTGKLRWHLNHLNTVSGQVGGLNFVESDVADFRLYLQEGGSVGINTSQPQGALHVANHAANSETELVISSPQDHYCSLRLMPAGYKESFFSATQHGATLVSREAVIYVGAATGGNLYIPRDTGQDLAKDWRLQWAEDTVRVQPKLEVAGTIQATGEIRSSGAKTFDIAHPERPGERLVHACLEGPEAGVYYRGEAALRGGTAIVTLPAYFETLTRPEGRTVQLTAKGRTPFLLSYEDIVDGCFTVHGTAAEGTFAWEVRAVRADIAPLVCEPGSVA